MLFNNILQAIGKTPMIQLHRVGSHLDCELYAKCEFLNPGGSIKDRIGYRMVEDAEKQGRIRPGDTLIEPTSGNTGIGIALAGAVKGYRVIITLPEKMSREKQVVLAALGAEIIRTPTEAAFDSPESHIGVAKKLEQQLPNAHILDQYANPSNPLAHEEGTAMEIWEDMQGRVDMVVMGAGTGGTISGVARQLKKLNPKVKIVGADPTGSILAGPAEIKSYKVEGIGYDFIPDVLDRKLVDEWVKTDDRQSFLLARQLIRDEGLLCGGSSGSALQAALVQARKLGKGQRCVVVLPDGVRNYMSKFVEDKWMIDNEFMGAGEMDGRVADLLATLPLQELITVTVDQSINDVIRLMTNRGISQVPVLSREGEILGMVTETSLIQAAHSPKVLQKCDLGRVMDRGVPTVDADTSLATLQRLLMQKGRAVVVDRDRKPLKIMTTIDLVEWMMTNV